MAKNQQPAVTEHATYADMRKDARDTGRRTNIAGDADGTRYFTIDPGAKFESRGGRPIVNGERIN